MFRGKGLGGVWAGPDCGILGLSSRWFEGFLWVCVGLSGFWVFFFRDARFFLSFCGIFFLFVGLGAQGF